MKRKLVLVFCIITLLFSITGTVAARFSSVEEFFLATKIRSIKLTTYSGMIAWYPLEEGERPRIIVEAEANGSSQKVTRQFLKQLEIQSVRTGSHLELSVIEPMLPPGISSTATNFIIYAGPRAIAEIIARTDNGSIVMDVEFDDIMRLSAQNGPITLKNGAGQITAITTNSEIEFGEIKFTDSSTFQTSNGKIKGKPRFPDDGLFVFQTTNAPIYLDVPENTFGKFSLMTSGGFIEFDLGYDRRSGETIVEVDRGNGPSIQVLTSNDDITVEDPHAILR